MDGGGEYVDTDRTGVGRVRVLVCGGRNYANREAVFSCLNSLPRLGLVVIQGGAQGADFWARRWSEEAGVAMIEERARWRDLSHPQAVVMRNKYGKYDASAGHRRNEVMLREHRPELVLAFPGGSGTTDMVTLADSAGIRVRCPDGDLWLPEALRGRFER
jgi:hypothetical protein